MANNTDAQNKNIDENNDKDNQNMAQKTPMCLINELARYNKIQAQYILEDETGPSHKKTFFVRLKLGNNEEYAANGSSIKKAQQSAATMALESTKYLMPQKRKKEKITQNGNLIIFNRHIKHINFAYFCFILLFFK